MNKIIDIILGFIWPPYRFHLKKIEFLARERESYADFYKNYYLPVLKKHSEDLLKNFKKGLECKKFLQ